MSKVYAAKRNSDDDYNSDKETNNLFYRQASSKMINNHYGDEYEYREEPVEAPSPVFCLPYLQAVLFATVLEDIIAQLRILDECNNELRIIKTMADVTVLRAKKYQIKQRRNTVTELLNIDPKSMGGMKYKLDKLAADRVYCAEVLMGTYIELALGRCFSTLTDNNNQIESREVYYAQLIEEEARNKICRRDLMKQLRQQRNHIKSVAYDTDLIVDQLKSRVEDATLNEETRARYIINWERARTEQHTQIILDKEAGPSESINCYGIRVDQENRIHSEIELLVNIFINETLMKVESWMNKYDTDMEAIDLKIQIMKNKYQDEDIRRMEMEKMYEDHELLMKNWIQFKTDREKARQYRDKMTKSAIIVQAWWRGLLVRLELGPYKPSKKRPKPAGGKKKK